jgi:arabinogalactan oligomer/maltooligosaccharide transport system substrate-binding protein
MNYKRLAALGLSALMAFGMAGCGSKSASQSTASAASEASSAAGQGEKKSLTLTVWGPQEDQADENGKWLQSECEAFAAEHPEWDITFEYGVCSEGEAKDKVASDATAAADVYMAAIDQIPDLINANAIAELGGSTVDAIKASSLQIVVDSVTYNGGVYGVPFATNPWFMYYDKCKFSEDDIKSLDTMLEKGKVSFPLTNSWYIASFYVANGCTLFGEDGTDEAAGIDFAGEKGTDVTKYLVSLAQNANFVNDQDGSGIAGLSDGSVSAMFSGSWDYSAVKEALGDNMGIAALPTVTINGEAKQMKSFGGSKAICVNPNTKNADVAVALASYLGSASAQTKHWELRSIVPSDTTVEITGDAQAQSLVDAQNNTMESTSIIQPVVAAMANYWTPAESMGKAIVNGEVTADNAAEKTTDMNDQMNTSAVE